MKGALRGHAGGLKGLEGRDLQGGFKGASRGLQGGFKEASRGLQGGFKGAGLEGGLKGAQRGLVLKGA